MADSIIYLVTGICFFNDDPDKVHLKEWNLDAYVNESEAWNKVRELRKKEQLRVDNLSSDDPAYLIVHEYSVRSILLFGKN